MQDEFAPACETRCRIGNGSTNMTQRKSIITGSAGVLVAALLMLALTPSTSLADGHGGGGHGGGGHGWGGSSHYHGGGHDHGHDHSSFALSFGFGGFFPFYSSY